MSLLSPLCTSAVIKFFELVSYNSKFLEINLIAIISLIHYCYYDKISLTLLINGTLVGFLILAIVLLNELATSISLMSRRFYMMISMIGAVLFLFCGIIIILGYYYENDNMLRIYLFGAMFLFVAVLFIIELLNLFMIRFSETFEI